MKFSLQRPRLYADFNGWFGELLCLSHSEVCKDENGAEVSLKPGMVVTALDNDEDDNGHRDDLIATGTVEPSPPWLQCKGSRWVLRIDENGIRHESDLKRDAN